MDLTGIRDGVVSGVCLNRKADFRDVFGRESADPPSAGAMLVRPEEKGYSCGSENNNRSWRPESGHKEYRTKWRTQCYRSRVAGPMRV